MQLNFRRLLTITFVCAVCFFFMFLFSTFLAVYFHKDGGDRVKMVVDKYHYVDDQRTLAQILSSADRYNRVYKMSSEIFADHCKKYTKSFVGKPKFYNEQGMHHTVQTEFWRLNIRYSRLISCPPFQAITFAVKETGGAPNARTYKKLENADTPYLAKTVKVKVGPITKYEYYMILEAGVFQFRREAIDHAWLVVTKDMPPHLAQVFGFKYSSIEDMFDPLNALKVMYILLWDARIKFNNDPSWYIPAIHWGIGRIYDYYLAGVPLPEEFRFNKGTPEEFARDPLNYYGVWNAYNSQFEKFTTKVYIDKSWLVRYEAECSRMEWNFIYTHKYVKKMIFIADRMEKRETAYIAMTNEYYIEQTADYKLLREKHRMVDDEYRKLIGLGKSGEKLWKLVFKEGFSIFKGIAAELRNEEVTKRKKAALISLIFVLCIIIILATGMVVVIIVYFIKKYKIKRKKCH